MKRIQSTRYRFDRIGNVVEDTRRMTPGYLDPDGNQYHKGDPLFAPKSSSHARREYKALRIMRRRAASPAGRAAVITAAIARHTAGKGIAS